MAQEAEEEPAQREEDYYRLTVTEVLDQKAVTKEKGLSEREAVQRHKRCGLNRIGDVQRKSALAILRNQFKSLVVLLLLAAAASAAVFGQIVEALAIAAALFINAAVGFGTEYTARGSMDALRRMSQITARVRRNGRMRELKAETLVPGDIVLLREGEMVPADLRLIMVENLQCNEAALTGESEPVSKTMDPLDVADAPLSERVNMAYKGTAITRGAAEGVVVNIGKLTEIGHISTLVAAAEKDVPPLERRLERLGHRLIFLVIGVGVIIGASGIAAGQDLALMIETAIVLAIAAVPEGLPVISTLALGRGMWRMARRNVLVKKLSAVEALGSTTLILTDKTGTLTENRMVLRRVTLVEGEAILSQEKKEWQMDNWSLDPTGCCDLMAALRVGVLCNNARIGSRDGAFGGDPMEVALLQGGVQADLDRDALLRDFPEAREESFESRTNMMATFHRQGDGYLVAVKGAPEAVLKAATQERRRDRDHALNRGEREAWEARNEALAAAGLRVLAVAEKQVATTTEDPYRDLTLLGLLGLYDPPRKSVAQALHACRNAGIRVVMVTGDQPATALNVAREVGIVEEEDARVMTGRDLKRDSAGDIRKTHIFARVSPEDKLTLVDVFQQAGEIVGMTGDGVNDGPALKKADVGIAMGQRGTEVAQDASDIILKDDAFESIVMAVRQGRTIFANIRKFVIFLLSGNLGQVIIVACAAFLGAPLPLLPLQILFLNMVLDVFPALALGLGEDEPAVMHHPPRNPAEPILTRDHWLAISGFGLLIGLSVLGAFAAALLVMDMRATDAVTISFLSYAFARLWHIFNMRSRDSHPLRNNITGNPYVWSAIALCLALLGAAIYAPPLALLLQLTPPTGLQWLLILGGSLMPLVVGQISIAVLQRRRDRSWFQSARE